MGKLLVIMVLCAVSLLFAAKENPNNFGLLGQGKTFSARSMSKGTLFIGTSIEWSQSIGRVVERSIYFENSPDAKPFETVSNLGEFTVLPFISTALSRFVEASISIPVYKDFTESQDSARQFSLQPNVANTSSFGVGDAEFFLKIK